MANAMSEAPLSANWRLLDPFGIEVQLTLRSESDEPEDVFDQLGKREKLITELLNAGYKSVNGYGGVGRTPTPPAVPVDPNAPVCECGTARLKKTGTNKRGPWTGWMCARRLCPPVWE
jgi:hypothetical protein